MFSSLLKTLQSALPKRFFLASFTPVLVFTLLNGAILYLEDPGFRAFARENFLATGDGGLDLSNMLFVLLGVALVGFLFSMTNTSLREILEGRYWTSLEWLQGELVRRETLRRDALLSEHETARKELDDLRRLAPGWQDTLRTARRRGHRTADTCCYPADHPVSVEIRAIDEARLRGRVLEVAAIGRTVRALEKVLRENRVEPHVPGREDHCIRLDRDHTTLVECFKRYAQERRMAQVVELENRKQTQFPAEDLAPTSVGNVARSIGSYARARYGFNLDLLWTRLQKVMQKDDHYQTVQQVQIQLDFLVSMFWLAAFSLMGWSWYELSRGTSAVTWLAIGALGLLLLWILYVLILETYRAFADLLRGAIDLFRFDLLEALHLPRPADSHQEQRLWLAVDRQLRYGEPQTLSFRHPD